MGKGSKNNPNRGKAVEARSKDVKTRYLTMATWTPKRFRRGEKLK